MVQNITLAEIHVTGELSTLNFVSMTLLKNYLLSQGLFEKIKLLLYCALLKRHVDDLCLAVKAN